MSTESLISVNPEVMGGTPVFVKTRVPIQTLFDYLEGGESIDDFVDDFPSVQKSLVVELLEEMKASIMGGPRAA